MNTSVNYAIDLARKHTDELGFIPRQGIERNAAAGGLYTQLYNDEPCGYLLHGPARTGRLIHVYQCAIQLDARRIKNATELVRDLQQRAIVTRARGIILNCASDLPANQFWKSTGFAMLSSRPGGSRRGRDLNIWCWLNELQHGQLSLPF